MTAIAQPSAPPGLQPTFVLVHGAFADASSWNAVIQRLQRGRTVVARPAPQVFIEAVVEVDGD
jgi:hypothetical protein